MFRRVSIRWMASTTGGGTAIRMAAHRPSAPTPPREAEAPAGVYLPWTARPWPVTHSVHHAQWKFLDTVFAHLATVTPAELSERAQDQRARDVLCDLEDPVVGLLRQQARHARQLRKQAKAARVDAATTTVDSDTSVEDEEAAVPAPQSSGSGRSEALASVDVDTKAPPAASLKSAAAATTVPGTAADAAAMSASSDDSTSHPAKQKKAKKSKVAKKAVAFIHYL